jgi:REP element-mobilizing transposase RayT
MTIHNGWFFVTNKADFAKDYFLGELRTLLKVELAELVKKTSGVGLDYYHIMPNHIHVILVFEDAEIPLSEFWRRFKAITTIKAKQRGFPGKSLWQRNYFEHVIRNDFALQKIREYIQNNPLKEDLPLEEIYQEVAINVR